MGKNSTKQGRKDTAAEIFNSIEAWREQAAVSNSPHTVEAYRNATDLYIRFLDQNQGITTKDFTWECFSREKIEKWMIWLTERGNKPQTVNLRLSHIREFLAYMEGRSAAAYGHLYHEADQEDEDAACRGEGRARRSSRGRDESH